jgi:phosphoglycerate dehydrogenase-like enzyme
MPVIYHQRNPIPASYEELLGARSVSLSALLRESDWLSLHAPHTPATEGMIDRNAFLAMKPNAFIINTARGGLIDEPALVDCLRERRIAGAGLDVFVEEPLPADHPLSRLENVVLSPHLGGGAGGGHRRHVSDLLENVARVARGEEPQHRVA